MGVPPAVPHSLERGGGVEILPLVVAGAAIAVCACLGIGLGRRGEPSALSEAEDRFGPPIARSVTIKERR